MSTDPVPVNVYFDPHGMYDGKAGCHRARLTNRHAVHGAGATAEAAVDDLIMTAQTLGYSADRASYHITNI